MSNKLKTTIGIALGSVVLGFVVLTCFLISAHSDITELQSLNSTLHSQVMYLEKRDQQNIIVGEMAIQNMESIQNLDTAVVAILRALEAQYGKKPKEKQKIQPRSNQWLTPVDLRRQDGGFYNLYEGQLCILRPSKRYVEVKELQF